MKKMTGPKGRNNSTNSSGTFLAAFGIQKGDVVSLIGAGGKTSLLFHLAGEARALGLKVLVTTSTKIYQPEPDQYDALELSGQVFKGLFEAQSAPAPGIYVAGMPSQYQGKICGPSFELLEKSRNHFDLILLEADGAGGKSLKGWNEGEPVVPEFSSITIGLLDIQSVGKTVCEALVHRLEIFKNLTGAEAGQQLSTHHLCQLVRHNQGLFGKAKGENILYINKVESAADQKNAESLQKALQEIKSFAGSLRDGTLLPSK